MSEINLKDFKIFLDKNKIITEDDLKQVLHIFDEKQITPKIKCKCILTRSTAEKVREIDFINFILDHIMFYVLRHDEYFPKNLTPKNFQQMARPLYLKAKSKFMTKNPETSGESGELTLFLLLESQGIIQVVHKMNLKTDNEIPVFGADAIHIQVDDRIILNYGESKMYKEFSSGLYNAIKTIESFDDDEEKFELNIVSSHIDDSRFDKYSEEILDLLLPYHQNKEKLGNAHAVFIGFNADFMRDLTKKGNETLDSYLKTSYEKIHSQLFEKIKTKIQESPKVNSRTFNFYLMPFTDVEEFRFNFIKELKK